MATTLDVELEREALRLCGRYIDEVVLGFGLCPWAEPALRARRVGRMVCLVADPTPAECLGFIDRFAAAHTPAVDIGLLIFPRHTAGWAAFDGFAERLRRADRDRLAKGAKPPFLIATFHPDGVGAFENPNQLVSFLRRSPDPLLQLVRAASVDRGKELQPTASEDVARRNYATMVGPADNEGARRLEAVVQSIRADRDSTYTRLGVGGG